MFIPCDTVKLFNQFSSMEQTTSAANKLKTFMGAIRTTRVNQDNDSNSIQTVIIIDESASVAKGTRRFTEKIIPLVLSKLPSKKSQLVHLLTFRSEKSSVFKKLQSILQKLDANKRIRIVVLTNAEVQDRQEVENFAETIMEFLSGSNSSADCHVVTLASECGQSLLGINDRTKKINHFDIDATESNDIIATRIGELLHADRFPIDKKLVNHSEVKGQSSVLVSEHASDVKQSEGIRNLDYVERAEFGPKMREKKMKRRHRRSCSSCGLCGILDICRCYRILIYFIIVAILLALFYFKIIKIEISPF